jgi:hypothetical protein
MQKLMRYLFKLNQLIMKNLTKIATVLMLLAAITFQVSGQTLKERIDQNKEIKVYLSNLDVRHNPNTNPPPGSQNKGTGCKAFTETTPFPADYIEAEKQVIDLLNKGFGTTTFIAGDISVVPLFASGMQKGNPDWLKLGEPLVVWILTSGTYNVEIEGLGSMVGLVNSLSIDSYLSFYGIVDGKIKVLGNKNLVTKKTPTIKTKVCDDYAYFVKNFPLSSLLDAFKSGIAEKTTDFATKEMASYEKAMKKKK